MYRLIIVLVGMLLLMQYSCRVDKNDIPSPRMLVPILPTVPFEYANINYPSHIQQAISSLDNTPTSNPITNHGATLGRVLFYDKALSENNQISCSSCHKASEGFADARAKSEGFLKGVTRRNSMSILNIRFYKRGKMFWDERANTLEEQVLLPIQDHIEMGMDLDSLVNRLEQTTYYAQLFEKAFGSSVITTERIAKSLAQFIRTLVTYESKFDKVIEGSATFSAQEQQGQTIYNTFGSQQGCVSCHGGDLIDQASYNLQIGQIPSFVNDEDRNDLGIYEATQMPSDSFRFKVSSLRNIEQTAPYMHDGSVDNLTDLFHSSHHNFGMTAAEVDALVAFLKTLTDHEIIKKEKFLDPFVEQ